MTKSDITPKVRGECVVAACRTGDWHQRWCSATGRALPCPPAVLSQDVDVFCPLLILVWHCKAAALACLPFPHSSAGIRHTSLAPVMMGLLRAEEPLWSAQSSQEGRKESALRRDSGQVRMRQGEGTESHFPHEHPVRAVWPLMGQSFATAAGELAPFQAVWLAQWKCCLHCLGRGPPKPAALVLQELLVTLEKPWEWLGEQKLLPPADEKTGSCHSPACRVALKKNYM